MKKSILIFTVVLSLTTFSISYAQLSHVFTYAGHVPTTTVYAGNVAVGPDGTVLLSHAFMGLLAYDHSDTSFFNLRQVNDQGSENCVIVRADSVVFVGINSSLYAYTYDDTSITNVGNIDLSPASGVMDLAIGPDGIVFAGTIGSPGAGGIRALSFTESTSFTLLAQIFDPRESIGIAVGPDSIIYVAGRDDGFYAFSFYDDSTFTQLDRINVMQAQNVAVGTDGTVFFANSNTGGLLAYSFTGASFDSITQWMDPQGAWDVAVASDGTIFLANSLDGLRALTFDGFTLTNTAHVNPGGSTLDVAVGPDGVIYTATRTEWNAFRYETATAIEDNPTLAPKIFNLSQNYPNPFNPSTTIKFQIPSSEFVTLKVYDLAGREVAVLMNEQKQAGSYSVKFGADRLASGMYFCRLEAGEFRQIRKMLLVR